MPCINPHANVVGRKMARFPRASFVSCQLLRIATDFCAADFCAADFCAADFCAADFCAARCGLPSFPLLALGRVKPGANISAAALGAIETYP